MKKPQNSFPRYHCWFSLICFIACLFLPAYYLETGRTEDGLGLLLIGWLGVFSGYYSWLANPIYLLALLFGAARRPRESAISSIVGLVIALTFLLDKKMPLDEAVHYSPIAARGWGYWLWLAAFAVLAIGSIIAMVRGKPIKSSEQPKQ